jgi:hypothetical protein
MRLLPVQTTDEMLLAFLPHWYPFLPKIAQRSKEPIAELAAKVRRKQVQPFLMWDEVACKAVALLGVSYHMRGDDIIAELVWMAGSGRAQWEGLLPEVEQYLIEHVGCAEIRPICRPGWSRMLLKHGYRITHYTMSKEVSHGRK